MTAHVDELGEPIATGRSAVVYPWPDGDDMVVKVFGPDYDPALVDAEEAASVELSKLRLSGIDCHGRVYLDRQAGLLFDRLHGESLTKQAERNPLKLKACARTLARVHVKVHRTPTNDFPDIRDATIAALDTEPLEFLAAGQRSEAATRLRAMPAGNRVLHLDFHSENVFSHHRTHAVIDWQTTMRGVPAADVAMTQLLLRDAELWPGTPALKKMVLQRVRRVVLNTYLSEYQRLTGTTTEEIDAWRLAVVVLRMSTLDIASERDAFRLELSSLLAGSA